jgi:hypothetical protein
MKEIKKTLHFGIFWHKSYGIMYIMDIVQSGSIRRDDGWVCIGYKVGVPYNYIKRWQIWKI